MPNLFYRQKRAPIVDNVEFPLRVEDLPKVLQQIMPLVERFDPLGGLRDVGVFLDYLAKQSTVKPGKVGIFGYCMGGAMAIRAAAKYSDKFAAVASFHAGGLASDDADSPHRLLAHLRATLYVAHADQDPHMSAEQIIEFERALSNLSIPHQVELYLGAHHHFTMEDLPAYNRAAAEKHWLT